MINQYFPTKLSFQIYETNVSIQKIDGSKLDIFGMVIISFSIKDKKRSYCFFKKTFLLADISIDSVLKYLFFTLSNVKIDFASCYIHL